VAADPPLFSDLGFGRSWRRGRLGEVGGCDLGFGRRGGGQRLLRFEAVSGRRFSYPEVWSEEMLNPVLVLQTQWC
jgi:hypothetical protein